MKSGAKLNWWTAIKILLAVGLTAAILARLNLRELGSLFAQIPPIWLAVSIGLYFLSNMAKALQYTALLENKVPYLKTLYIVTVQNTISNFVATGAGIASLLASLKIDEGVKVSKSSLMFIVTKVMDLFFIGLFLGISCCFVWQDAAGLQPVVVLLLLGIVLLVLVFLAAVFLRQAFVNLLVWFCEKTRLQRFSFVGRIIDVLQTLAGQPRERIYGMVLRSFLCSFLYFLVILGLSFTGYRIFAIPVGFWAMVFITCLMQLISLIPISVFGGLGINDVSFFFLFGLFNIPQNSIPALLVGLRVLGYLWILTALVYIPVYSLVLKTKKRNLG